MGRIVTTFLVIVFVIFAVGCEVREAGQQSDGICTCRYIVTVYIDEGDFNGSYGTSVEPLTCNDLPDLIGETVAQRAIQYLIENNDAYEWMGTVGTQPVHYIVESV